MPLNPKTGLPVVEASIAQAAEHAECSVRSIFNYLNDGKLTRYRRRHRVFVDLNEIDILFALVADPAGGAA